MLNVILYRIIAFNYRFNHVDWNYDILLIMIVLFVLFLGFIFILYPKNRLILRALIYLSMAFSIFFLCIQVEVCLVQIFDPFEEKVDFTWFVYERISWSQSELNSFIAMTLSEHDLQFSDLLNSEREDLLSQKTLVGITSCVLEIEKNHRSFFFCVFNGVPCWTKMPILWGWSINNIIFPITTAFTILQVSLVVYNVYCMTSSTSLQNITWYLLGQSMREQNQINTGVIDTFNELNNRVDIMQGNIESNISCTMVLCQSVLRVLRTVNNLYRLIEDPDVLAEHLREAEVGSSNISSAAPSAPSSSSASSGNQ